MSEHTRSLFVRLRLAQPTLDATLRRAERKLTRTKDEIDAEVEDEETTAVGEGREREHCAAGESDPMAVDKAGEGVAATPAAAALLSLHTGLVCFVPGCQFFR